MKKKIPIVLCFAVLLFNSTTNVCVGAVTCINGLRQSSSSTFINLHLTQGRAANTALTPANSATLNLRTVPASNVQYRTQSGSPIQLAQSDFLTFGAAGGLLINWQDGNTVNQRNAIVDENYYSIFIGVADALNAQVFDLESLKPVMSIGGVDTFVSISSVPNDLLLPGITHVLKEAVNETSNPFPSGVYNNWKAFTGFKYRQFKIENSNPNNDVFQNGYALKPVSGRSILVDESDHPSQFYPAPLTIGDNWFEYDSIAPTDGSAYPYTISGIYGKCDAFGSLITHDGGEEECLRITYKQYDTIHNYNPTSPPNGIGTLPAVEIDSTIAVHFLTKSGYRFQAQLIDVDEEGNAEIFLPKVYQMVAATRITTQPMRKIACPSSNVTFTVGSNCTDPSPAYQWKKNGTDISGQTAATLTLTNITTTDEADYSVTVTTNCGVFTSRKASLTLSNTGTWVGSVSSDISDAANWCGGLPNNASAITISPLATNMPLFNSNKTFTSINIKEGATVNIANGNTLNITGTLTNNGVVKGAGTLVLNGSSNQIITGAGEVENVSINNAAGATISATGGQLDVMGALTITNGTLTTNGNLTLLSDKNHTGNIGTIGSGAALVGNLDVQKYIQGGGTSSTNNGTQNSNRGFRFLAHPFTVNKALNILTDDEETEIDITGSGGETNGFTTTVTNNPSAFQYDVALATGSNAAGIAAAWKAYTSANGTAGNTWDRYKGLRILYRGVQGTGLYGIDNVVKSTTLQMTGAVNTGTQTIPLTYNSTYNTGWNLVGNPYPSNVDMSLISSGRRTNIDGAGFYVWNPKAATRGAYETKAWGSSYVLPAYSSFFVNTTAAGSIQFMETDKTAQAATQQLLRSQVNNSLVLKATTNAIIWDEIQIVFNDKATTAKENLDAIKLLNPEVSFYTLSSKADMLAIDARKLDSMTIPVGLISNGVRNYTLTVATMPKLPNGYSLFFKDKVTATETLLQANTIINMVDSSVNVYNNHRYQIVVQKQIVNTPIVVTNQTKVYPSITPTGLVTVEFSWATSAPTSIQVFSINGQLLQSVNAGNQAMFRKVMQLPIGAVGEVIVRVQHGDDVSSHKVVVGK